MALYRQDAAERRYDWPPSAHEALAMNVDPCLCPHGCRHVASDVHARDVHTLLECPMRSTVALDSY